MILSNGPMSCVESKEGIITKTFKCQLMYLKEKYFYEHFSEFAPKLIYSCDNDLVLKIERLNSWREIKEFFSIDDKRLIARRLIVILKKLWDKGYIHGDVHMDNVVFDSELNPYLIDFEWFHHKVHDKFEDDIDMAGHHFVHCFDGAYRSVRVALEFTKEDALEMLNEG
jgi:serine/threonine protein kinase